MTKLEHEKEVKDNYEFFKKEEPKFKRLYSGKYALLRKKKIIAFYDTVGDADTTGTTFFKDQLFSIQKVAGNPLQYRIHSVPMSAF